MAASSRWVVPTDYFRSKYPPPICLFSGAAEGVVRSPVLVGSRFLPLVVLQIFPVINPLFLLARFTGTADEKVHDGQSLPLNHTAAGLMRFWTDAWLVAIGWLAPLLIVWSLLMVAQGDDDLPVNAWNPVVRFLWFVFLCVIWWLWRGVRRRRVRICLVEGGSQVEIVFPAHLAWVEERYRVEYEHFRTGGAPVVIDPAPAAVTLEERWSENVTPGWDAPDTKQEQKR